MTSVKHRPTTAQDVLDAVDRLAPTIRARALDIESARRLPRDLLGELVTAGCFRVLVPAGHGGIGADLADGIRVFESLARADASTAWTVMIGGCSWLDLTGLPRASFDALFPDAGTIIAGVFNPSGSITAAEDGYRVTGRWSFASGCEHADWIYGNCVEGVVDGVPQLRIAVFTPDQVEIEDTWDVSGLRGTGSHHFHVTDVAVPAERTLRPLIDDPCVDDPIARIPIPSLAPLAIAAVAIGIARGALDDILALSADKVPLLAGAPLAANPLFQLELATADTEVRAARALVYETAESTWASAVAGSALTLEQRALIRATAVWATARAAAVVETAYRAGGGTSVYADCPLQRRLRDVHAMTQHFLVKRDTLITAGAVLAGQGLTAMVF